MEIHHKIEVIMKEDDINKAWGVTDLLTQRCTTQTNRLLSVFDDCKWTCPKLQFMIQNKFYRKDNPFGFHGYPEALAAKRSRFERGV